MLKSLLTNKIKEKLKCFHCSTRSLDDRQKWLSAIA